MRDLPTDKGAIGIMAAFTLSATLLTWNSTALAQTCVSVADSVALEPVPASDLLTVPVTINGSLKHFLLDIGTNPTEVSQATVTELGLPEDSGGDNSSYGGHVEDSDTTSFNTSRFANLRATVYDVKSSISRDTLRPRVRVGSFSIGDANNQHMVFTVSNDREMGKSEPYDGLLTDNFFKQYDVELDFANKRLSYLDPTTCTDPHQVAYWSGPNSDVAVIPITVSLDGSIQVPVMIAGRSFNAVIDTSSARTVMRRDIAEFVLGFKADSADMIADGDLKDGMGQQVYIHTFPQISFPGGLTAVNVPALIQTNSLIHKTDSGMILGSRAISADSRIPDLTLGMDVLSQVHLYVAFGQGKLYATSTE